MTWRRWTAADDMAVAHPAAGETLDDLASRLDRTPDAIVGHRSVLRARGVAVDALTWRPVRMRTPRITPPAQDTPEDRRLFLALIATVPMPVGGVEPLLRGLRASGAWRTLAREWLDRQAAS